MLFQRISRIRSQLIGCSYMACIHTLCYQTVPNCKGTGHIPSDKTSGIAKRSNIAQTTLIEGISGLQLDRQHLFKSCVVALNPVLKVYFLAKQYTIFFCFQWLLQLKLLIIEKVYGKLLSIYFNMLITVLLSEEKTI